MSILIKGMEMPTEGYIDVRIKCNGTASFAIADNPYFKAVEAIPVPTHGDLIDRDALAEDGWVLTKQVMRMGGYAIHELPLKNPTIPVIIPAEDGK